jgi:hypothetical protein
MVKTYLELPHMLPVTIKSGSDMDHIWIVQPAPEGYEDVGADEILLDRSQVRDVIKALKAYLQDSQGFRVAEAARKPAGDAS